MTQTANLAAYHIYGVNNNDNMVSVPQAFYTFIDSISYPKRFDLPIPLEANTKSCNIRNLVVGRPVTGDLLQISSKQVISLSDINSGEDDELPIPTDKADTEFWPFVIKPKYNLIVIEQKGHSPERKINRFLNHHLDTWSGRGHLESIDIKAIPIETDGVGFLKKNPDLRKFEAKLDVRNLGENFGTMFQDIFGNGGEQPNRDEVYIKIELTTGRSKKNMPEALVSKLADFLETIGPDNIQHSSVKEAGNPMSTKLLNAMHRRTITIEEGGNKLDLMIDFADEIVQEIGTELQNHVL